MIGLTDQFIDVQQQAIIKLSSNSAGAIATFIGTVRNMTDRKRVVKMEFEFLKKVALTELQNILERTKNSG